MHLFLKKIYRKNPFPKIYRINQCEVLTSYFLSYFWFISFRYIDFSKFTGITNYFSNSKSNQGIEAKIKPNFQKLLVIFL